MTNWPEMARRFAESDPARLLDRKAVDWLMNLRSGQPVVAACSGGADSVFLVLCLHAIFADDPERLIVAHFNHGLRGAESDGDAAFVRQMAEDLGHCFELGQPTIPLDTDEACLRQARYGWLSQIYRRVGAGALVVGQHADDLIETQLMALLSGAGPAGFANPMPLRHFPDGQVRLRPLLPLNRRDILALLDKLPVPYRTDASNLDTTYTRNWLRREILPLLEAGFPQDIHAGAARTRQLMEETVATLDAIVQSLQLDFSSPARLELATLAGQPPGLVRRAIMAWWMRHYPDQPLPTRPGDELVQAIASGQGGRIVPIGVVSGSGENPQVLDFKENGTLFLRPEKAASPDRWSASIHWHWQSGPVFLPGGQTLAGQLVKWSTSDAAPYKSANPEHEAWLAGIEGSLEVRQWIPGDRYRPLGAPGSRKVQDIFTDAKLNSEQKAHRPVILDRSGAIVWIPGFPPAEPFRICQNDNSALQLTYNMQYALLPLHHG